MVSKGQYHDGVEQWGESTFRQSTQPTSDFISNLYTGCPASATTTTTTTTTTKQQRAKNVQNTGMHGQHAQGQIFMPHPNEHVNGGIQCDTDYAQGSCKQFSSPINMNRTEQNRSLLDIKYTISF